MTAWVIPALTAFTAVYALWRGCDVYSAFLKGARKGLETVLSIFPAILVMLTLIAMLQASGAIEMFSFFLRPVFDFLGIPQECISLALLRPFSGSGALSLGSEIIKKTGPQSYPGLVAAVMLGSSETSLYTIAVYSAYLRTKNTRYAAAAALIGDFAAYVAAAFAVRLLFF
ncbi:nucleoside recognition domain-containing protein [Acidaminobacterium chupaoyuni]